MSTVPAAGACPSPSSLEGGGGRHVHNPRSRRRPYRPPPGRRWLIRAGGAAAVCALFTVAAPAGVLAGFAGLAAGHLAMHAAYERKLGGYTGDYLGGVQQMSELGMYLGVVAAT